MKIKKELVEVNVNLALEMMGGYEQIFEKVIESFLQSQANVIEDIDYHIKNNNLSEAKRIVHTCKGNNIGAVGLKEISALLESAIIQKDEPLIKKYFNDFKPIFKQVLEDLHNIEF